MVNGRVTKYIYDAWNKADERKFGHRIGCDKGQQTWESLGMLVAMRAWKDEWATSRTCLTLQGDSMTALYMAGSTHSKSEVNVHVARELSLLLGNAAYRPDFIEHIPGISNVLPDFLSRIYEPGKSATPWPEALAGAVRTQVPHRGATWYVAAVPPRRAQERNRE